MLYWKTCLALFLALAFIFIGQVRAVSGQVQLDISTNKAVYHQTGDTLSIQVDVTNDGPQIPVDVHLAIIPPTGKLIYEWPDWNTNFTPAISNWALPKDLVLNQVKLLTLSLDGEVPFDETGTYTLVLAFMEPRTFEAVGNIGTTTFNVSSSGLNYELSGTPIPVGDEFQVNTYEDDYQDNPSNFRKANKSP